MKNTKQKATNSKSLSQSYSQHKKVNKHGHAYVKSTSSEYKLRHKSKSEVRQIKTNENVTSNNTRDKKGCSVIKPCPRGFYCPLKTTKPLQCLQGYYSNITGTPSFSWSLMWPSCSWFSVEWWRLTLPPQVPPPMQSLMPPVPLAPSQHSSSRFQQAYGTCSVSEAEFTFEVR